MIQTKEHLAIKMAAADFTDVQAAYDERCKLEADRELTKEAWMAAQGFEPVAASDGAIVTDDGREVVYERDQAWALRLDVHAGRLSAAFEAEARLRATEVKNVAGTEMLSGIVCPKCGDALQCVAVCPKCAVGKLGYRYQYICVCGGVDVVSKTRL